MSPVLTKLWFGKEVFFRKHKKKNYIITQIVKLAECKHKEITWFYFCENKTSKQLGLLLHICPLYSRIAAQNYVPPSEIT